MSSWNPNVPHCNKEARILEADGSDGGGHWGCLAELNPDGSCPNEEHHHDVYVAREKLRTECRPGSHLGNCRC